VALKTLNVNRTTKATPKPPHSKSKSDAEAAALQIEGLMIQDVIQSITSAMRKLFANWGALLISFALYAALVGILTLYFSTIREATTMEVLLSFAVLPLAAIVLFFTWQAMGVSYVRVGVGAGYLLKRALRDCWALILVGLPLFALAYLTAMIPSETDPKWMGETMGEHPTLAVALTWVRSLLLYVVWPLIAIHFWIAAAREGIGATLRSALGQVSRALSPRPVLIYLLVVTVFGAIAYFLFFTRTPAKNEWMDLWFVGARVSLALTAIFLGWMITLGAMAELTARRAMGELEV
jgi:hypothetical protein